ncbi:MAG: carbohydrate binding family 9 domain-containing protein, partial [Candidatus Aminicenantes bacterium]|nr:carbohydrate binding family 9 domain-containing protein [Candidatus Aminicenantes bacterium]
MFRFALIRNNPGGFLFLFFVVFFHFLFSHAGLASNQPSEHTRSEHSHSEDGSSSRTGSVRAVFLQAPVVIDGILDEEAWQNPGYTGFRQSDPIDGDPATEKTEVWIAYDAQNLYIAARMFDSDPAGIVGRLGRRDDELESDWFVFAVDPYFDRRSGFEFQVNPSGSIMDGTLFNDEGRDTTWDGIWESAAVVDDKGWTVEIRIPFEQLHFKEQESTTWGVNFFRTIKRKNEIDAYGWVPKEESGYVSRFVFLTGLDRIQPSRLVELLPFTVGRAQFSPSIPGDPFHTGRDFSGNGGIDLKATLRSNLTLNLTVNPDFGQVEVDPA